MRSRQGVLVCPVSIARATRVRVAGALPLALLLAAGMIAACGDDLKPLDGDDGGAQADDGTEDDDGEDGGAACVSTEVDEFPDGPFGSPEDLTLKGFDCPEGGLADVDLNGRWSIADARDPFDPENPGNPFNFQMPLIKNTCEEGLEFGDGVPEDALVHLDETNLFVRTERIGENFSVFGATRVCGSSGPDEVAILLGQCFQTPDLKEPACSTSVGAMKRLGRPPGEAEAEGLELVSEWQGGDDPWPASSATNVQVVGGIAFVSRLAYRDGDTSDLRVVDVSNPEKPRDLGSLPVEKPNFADFNDLKAFRVGDGNYAVLAGNTCPIVDASNPDQPLSSLGEFAHSVFVREDAMGRPLAYLATTGATPDVPIYDLSNPAMPELVERVPLPQTADPGAPKGTPVAIHDLYAEEDRLYINAEFDGYIVMDRVGQDWVEAGRLPPNGYSHANWVGEVAGRRVAITGGEGYNAHLQVVDIDPDSEEFMTEIGKYQTRPEVSIHNMMLLGDRAYVAYYHDGVRVLDLSDPTSPELVAYHHTWDIESGPGTGFEGAISLDVDVEAGLIYVADMSRGLLILRETR
jgi:hypothetical protein